MTDCGFLLEWLDAKGHFYCVPCWQWSCPHQPITEYQVWTVQAVRGGPDIWRFHGQSGPAAGRQEDGAVRDVPTVRPARLDYQRPPVGSVLPMREGDAVMSAIDMIKAQQALAKAREDQRKERLAAIAAQRERDFAPVKAFIQDLADAGAIYTYIPGAYNQDTSPVATCLRHGYRICLSKDYVTFRSIRWNEHITAECRWPTDEGNYPGDGPFALTLARDYPYHNDPVKYFSKAEELIEALAAAIQHAISFPT